MAKYIVCSGCSFTRQEKRLGLDGDTTNFMYDVVDMWRWPHWIQKMYPKKIVYNMGNPTNGNNIIAVSTLSKVTELLKRGIDPNDIQVFIQWSDMIREGFFLSQSTLDLFDYKVDVNPDKGYNVAAHTNFFANKNKNLNKYGHYVINSGQDCDHIDDKLRKLVLGSVSSYVSIERATIRFYESILLIQNFLKLNGIKYLMFNYPRNFSFENSSAKYNLKNNYNKKIPKNIFDFKYDNPYIDYFIENVDWDNIWFYKDDNTNVGGLIDFAIMNYDYDRDGKLFMEHELDSSKNVEELIKIHKKQKSYHSGHISSNMNKVFVEKILQKYLDN